MVDEEDKSGVFAYRVSSGRGPLESLWRRVYRGDGGAGGILRAAEDEEAENRGSALGDFGVWPGLVDLNQGGNGSIRKEIGPGVGT